MDLRHKKVAFNDVTILERSKKDEIYNAGILIQLSASNGQILLITEPQTVESKYGIIKVKNDSVDLEYLFYILEMRLPDFLARYQNGININPQIFDYFRFDVHIERETQRRVAEILNKMQDWIKIEEQTVKKWQDTKAYYLDKCYAVLR